MTGWRSLRSVVGLEIVSHTFRLARARSLTGVPILVSNKYGRRELNPSSPA